MMYRENIVCLLLSLLLCGVGIVVGQIGPAPFGEFIGPAYQTSTLFLGGVGISKGPFDQCLFTFKSTVIIQSDAYFVDSRLEFDANSTGILYGFYNNTKFITNAGSNITFFGNCYECEFTTSSDVIYHADAIFEKSTISSSIGMVVYSDLISTTINSNGPIQIFSRNITNTTIIASGGLEMREVQLTNNVTVEIYGGNVNINNTSLAGTVMNVYAGNATLLDCNILNNTIINLYDGNLHWGKGASSYFTTTVFSTINVYGGYFEAIGIQKFFATTNIYDGFVKMLQVTDTNFDLLMEGGELVSGPSMLRVKNFNYFGGKIDTQLWTREKAYFNGSINISKNMYFENDVFWISGIWNSTANVMGIGENSFLHVFGPGCQFIGNGLLTFSYSQFDYSIYISKFQSTGGSVLLTNSAELSSSRFDCLDCVVDGDGTGILKVNVTVVRSELDPTDNKIQLLGINTFENWGNFSIDDGSFVSKYVNLKNYGILKFFGFTQVQATYIYNFGSVFINGVMHIDDPPNLYTTRQIMCGDGTFTFFINSSSLLKIDSPDLVIHGGCEFSGQNNSIMELHNTIHIYGVLPQTVYSYGSTHMYVPQNIKTLALYGPLIVHSPDYVEIDIRENLTVSQYTRLEGNENTQIHVFGECENYGTEPLVVSGARLFCQNYIMGPNSLLLEDNAFVYLNYSHSVPFVNAAIMGEGSLVMERVMIIERESSLLINVTDITLFAIGGIRSEGNLFINGNLLCEGNIFISSDRVVEITNTFGGFTDLTNCEISGNGAVFLGGSINAIVPMRNLQIPRLKVTGFSGQQLTAYVMITTEFDQNQNPNQNPTQNPNQNSNQNPTQNPNQNPNQNFNPNQNQKWGVSRLEIEFAVFATEYKNTIINVSSLYVRGSTLKNAHFYTTNEITFAQNSVFLENTRFVVPRTSVASINPPFAVYLANSTMEIYTTTAYFAFSGAVEYSGDENSVIISDFPILVPTKFNNIKLQGTVDVRSRLEISGNIPNSVNGEIKVAANGQLLLNNKYLRFGNNAKLSGNGTLIINDTVDLQDGAENSAFKYMLNGGTPKFPGLIFQNVSWRGGSIMQNLDVINFSILETEDEPRTLSGVIRVWATLDVSGPDFDPVAPNSRIESYGSFSITGNNPPPPAVFPKGPAKRANFYKSGRFVNYGTFTCKSNSWSTGIFTNNGTMDISSCILEFQKLEQYKDMNLNVARIISTQDSLTNYGYININDVNIIQVEFPEIFINAGTLDFFPNNMAVLNITATEFTPTSIVRFQDNIGYCRIAARGGLFLRGNIEIMSSRGPATYCAAEVTEGAINNNANIMPSTLPFVNSGSRIFYMVLGATPPVTTTSTTVTFNTTSGITVPPQSATTTTTSTSTSTTTSQPTTTTTTSNTSGTVTTTVRNSGFNWETTRYFGLNPAETEDTGPRDLAIGLAVALVLAAIFTVIGFIIYRKRAQNEKEKEKNNDHTNLVKDKPNTTKTATNTTTLDFTDDDSNKIENENENENEVELRTFSVSVEPPTEEQPQQQPEQQQQQPEKQQKQPTPQITPTRTPRTLQPSPRPTTPTTKTNNRTSPTTTTTPRKTITVVAEDTIIDDESDYYESVVSYDNNSIPGNYLDLAQLFVSSQVFLRAICNSTLRQELDITMKSVIIIFERAGLSVDLLEETMEREQTQMVDPDSFTCSMTKAYMEVSQGVEEYMQAVLGDILIEAHIQAQRQDNREKAQSSLVLRVAEMIVNSLLESTQHIPKVLNRLCRKAGKLDCSVGEYFVISFVAPMLQVDPSSAPPATINLLSTVTQILLKLSIGELFKVKDNNDTLYNNFINDYKYDFRAFINALKKPPLVAPIVNTVKDEEFIQALSYLEHKIMSNKQKVHNQLLMIAKEDEEKNIREALVHIGLDLTDTVAKPKLRFGPKV